MLDLLVLKELERKKKIPKELLLRDRKKEFIINSSGKKEQKSLNLNRKQEQDKKQAQP